MTDRIDTTRQPATDDYAEALGVKLRGGTEARGRCPVHGGDARDSFAVNRRTGVWQCFSCGAKGGDSIALYMAIHGVSFPDAAAALGCSTDAAAPGALPLPPRPIRQAEPDPDEIAEALRKRARAADVWRTTSPIARDTPAADYLLGRGCVLPPIDGDLRWLRRLTLFGFDGPALVGRISAATDATRGQGLHLTWIEQDGGRWRRKDRRYLGAKAGGVIRLWPDEAVARSLAVGEGIETVLAGAHIHRPAWACLDAGNLGNFSVLEGIETLVVFADRDLQGVGQRDAAKCARRWRDAGKETVILASTTVGNDINDEVAA